MGLGRTLEGLTSLTDSLAELLRSSLEDRTFASALQGRMSDMQERCGRFEDRARKKRELICNVMEEAELEKLTEPDLTVSLRPSRAPLAVVDEDLVPEAFWPILEHGYANNTGRFLALACPRTSLWDLHPTC